MRIVLVPALLVSLAAAGCAGGSSASGDGTTVVAAFFPLAEAARVVGGNDVRVVDLTPPGVEPHDLELTTTQVDDLLDADLVIVLGGGFQPAVEDVAADRDGATLDVLDALGIDGGDPHVWLDPLVMADIVDLVADALGAEPVADVRADLEGLDERYRGALATCERDVVVTSHEAYGHLVGRYGLREESITGLVPESEPDPDRLDDLARLVDAEGVTTIFTEPLLPRRVADTLARETGAEVAVLDPLESDPGTSYVAAMDANLEVLVTGLRCAAS